MSRKIISVSESSSLYIKACNRVEGILSDINKISKNKIKQLKSADEFGDSDKSKIADLDELATELDKCYNMLYKL